LLFFYLNKIQNSYKFQHFFCNRDYLAVYLDVIDKDKSSNTELVRWIMKFPYPLYPREYVYVRRYCADLNHNLLMLVSRSLPNIHLPDLPNTKLKHTSPNPNQHNYVRVTQYKSNIVIMPIHDFDKPGLIYVIQYYDVNKAKIPKIAYKWMAASGLPDYINKVHKATLRLNHRHEIENKHNEDLKKPILNLNDQLKKYDSIVLDYGNNDKKDEHVSSITLNNQTVNLSETLIQNKSINQKDNNETINNLEISSDKKDNMPLDIVLVDHDSNSNKSKLKTYFISVLEEINDEFISANEPHPLFYN
jgi:hypothetical protein